MTGAGVALDAASRGLSVCLVEKRDFSSGTSSRSSKLIHGGLRYLEQFDFGLVREALSERRVLLEDVAPHLVRPAPFLLPLRHRIWERGYIGAGVLLYDLLAGRNAAVPRHRHLSHTRCMALAPSLDPKAFVGGIQYYDAQIDDARHTVVVARTAVKYGAVCLSAVHVDRVLVENGRACGVEVRDTEQPDAEPFAIRSRAVINATGVWTSDLERSAGVEKPLRVRASKGVHLVVPRTAIDSNTAMILRTEKSVLFVIPWGDRWLLGTTDTDWQFGLDHPSVSSADIEYVLKWTNSVMATPVTKDDVVGVYAGLRPLISGGATATTKLSREHAINVSLPGLVSIAGGKYTTYRLMAIDAVDAAAKELGTKLPPSPTGQIGLHGAEGHDTAEQRLANHHASKLLPTDALAHLVARYGSAAEEILDVIQENPSLAEPLPGPERPTTQTHPDPDDFDTAHLALSTGGRYLQAEAVHAVRCEGALHVDDILTRRTRVSIESNDRGLAASEVVAALMASELNWTERQTASERDHYRARVDSERAAGAQSTDAAADAQRSKVLDSRLVANGR